MTRPTRFRLLAVILVTVGLLAPFLGPSSPASAVADVRTDRLGGANRFETAAAIARSGHPSARTALIANGTNFPDALAGSYLAGAVGAPILLVYPNAIPEITSSTLRTIGVTDVILLGGPAAISAGVEAQFRQNYGVTRVAGDDRYKTAVEVARRGAIGGVGTVDGLRTAFLTTGQNFPDALGAGPLAYDGRLPVFLTRNDSLPPEVSQALRDLNIEHVVILGGTQAVSENVESQARGTGATTERLNGRNRAETATFVADFAMARLGFDGVNVILARGDDYPDALAGGPLGGVRRAVILLTATPTQLAIETRNWLEDHFGSVARITALGGTAAISDAVLREAEQAAETNNLPPSRVDLTISGGSMNGGPEWQYQESDASPSKSLTLTAVVTSDPPSGSSADAERVPAAREDVVFNIRPTQGDNAANNELNLTAQTDADGVARITYTRGQPGTDTITVRLADDPGINDSGTGRWNTEPMPLSLSPDTAQSLEANQTREFTVCVPGPEGGFPSLGGDELNLTTVELVDDDPSNDTNVAALRFSSNVEDDRADSDETIGKVTTAEPEGCETFTVTSNSAQIFTLMAFEDNVVTPAANDDNTNPTEYRDAAGPTTFGSNTAGLNMTPANDGSSTTVITRRNGQQIVYRVSSVDSQGEPSTVPVDVSFEQLTDNSSVSTTTAEFDWYDNSASPSTQEGEENTIPGSATPTGTGTTRIEVTPNSNGVFTFAITNRRENTSSTSGNPIAWIDIQGGTSNRPDPSEPQVRGENFTFNAGSLVTASLESLGCPPGTDQRGHPDGNNPFSIQDPCLGRDVLASDPHVPWSLDAVATTPSSQGANAATGEELNASRGDVMFRFTYRDALGEPNGDTLIGDPVIFEIDVAGLARQVNVAPNDPNEESLVPLPIAATPAPIDGVVEVTMTNSVAEIVVDAASAGAVTVRARFESGMLFECITGDDSVLGYCTKAVTYVAPSVDTTVAGDIALANRAAQAQCPSPIGPPAGPGCLNGNLTVIDKARDSYVMNTGGTSGAQAYVVYAVGGGGRTGGAERPTGIDDYYIDGLVAAPDAHDVERCSSAFNPAPNLVAGCARFETALSFDDRMVYEFSGPAVPRTQSHFLTNGTAPVS